MTAQDNIITHFLEAYEPALQDTTKDILRPHLQVLDLPRKHLLIQEGQRCQYMYLIIQGAARSYYNHHGIEVNTWFAFEDEVAGSLRNFNDQPSRESIELLEDSQLIAFHIPGLKAAMGEHVEVAQFVYRALLEYTLFLEDRIYLTHLRSAAERYEALQHHEPEIFQRVPLTYIASFLGISRETLSRLRAS